MGEKLISTCLLSCSRNKENAKKKNEFSITSKDTVFFSKWEVVFHTIEIKQQRQRRKKANKTLTLKKRGCLDTTVEINCDIKAFFRWGEMISWRLRLRVSPPRKNPEKEHQLKSVPLIATRSPARLWGGGGREVSGDLFAYFCLIPKLSQIIGAISFC